MKLKFEAKKRTRFLNTHFYNMSADTLDWWFNYNTNKFENNPKAGEKGLSSYINCYSVRAFRRRLKSLPKGVQFTLVNKYVGFCVIGEGGFKG